MFGFFSNPIWNQTICLKTFWPSPLQSQWKLPWHWQSRAIFSTTLRWMSASAAALPFHFMAFQKAGPSVSATCPFIHCSPAAPLLPAPYYTALMSIFTSSPSILGQLYIFSGLFSPSIIPLPPSNPSNPIACYCRRPLSSLSTTVLCSY